MVKIDWVNHKRGILLILGLSLITIFIVLNIHNKVLTVKEITPQILVLTDGTNDILSSNYHEIRYYEGEKVKTTFFQIADSYFKVFNIDSDYDFFRTSNTRVLNFGFFTTTKGKVEAINSLKGREVVVVKLSDTNDYRYNAIATTVKDCDYEYAHFETSSIPLTNIKRIIYKP